MNFGSNMVPQSWSVPNVKKRQDLVFRVKLQFKSNLYAMQFRKPQVQKLCFIPPKIIFIEVHFWLVKILGLKRFFCGVLLVVLVLLVTWVITP